MGARTPDDEPAGSPGGRRGCRLERARGISVPGACPAGTCTTPRAPVGLQRRLFCGNEEGGRRAATAFTIVGSCKAECVGPLAYLTNVLTRLPELNVW